MLPAYYICCIDSYAFKTSFIMEANNMNPDQSKEPSEMGSYCNRSHQSTSADEKSANI